MVSLPVDQFYSPVAPRKHAEKEIMEIITGELEVMLPDTTHWNPIIETHFYGISKTRVPIGGQSKPASIKLTPTVNVGVYSTQQFFYW